jgi:hypothetical protein
VHGRRLVVGAQRELGAQDVQVTAFELEAGTPILAVLDVCHQAALEQLAAATARRQTQRGFAIERERAAIAQAQLGQRAAVGANE